MLDYGEMFSPDGTQFKWNSHSISAAERCLRYYQYTIIEGWRSQSEESVHLTFGSHYAKALQRYYLFRTDGMDCETAIREVVFAALVDTWPKDAEGPWTPPPGKSAKDRFTLIRTIVWYFEEFRDDLPVLSFHDQPAVEVSFTLEFDDDILLVGTLDRVVNYGSATWIMDQKTTGTTLTPYYFEQWNPSTQMSAYTYAGQAVFSEPIKGVLIDAVQIAVGFSRFERVPTYRTQAQLEEWRESALYHIHAARDATRRQSFPMNTSSCTMYGGCPFRKICQRSPEVRPNFLQGEFTRTIPEREV